MESKRKDDFENLDDGTEIVSYRRTGRVNTAALRKSSQENKPNRRNAIQVNVNAINGLRKWSLECKQSDYSIYSLAEVLYDLGYGKLTQWRYAKKVKTALHQLALRDMEKQDESSNKEEDDRLKLVPFVFNLSYSLQQKMLLSKRKEMTCCMNIINNALQREIGRKVELWFQYEMAPVGHQGKPHIQGSMLISIKEMKQVRRAFHRINGEVDDDFKRYAFRYRLKKRYELAEKHGFLYTDLNWASYCAKETARTLLTFVDQRLNDWGRVVAESRGLNSKSRLTFEDLRSALEHSTQQQITF